VEDGILDYEEDIRRKRNEERRPISLLYHRQREARRKLGGDWGRSSKELQREAEDVNGEDRTRKRLEACFARGRERAREESQLRVRQAEKWQVSKKERPHRRREAEHI